MIIENCGDYYGILNGLDIVTAGKFVEKLRAEVPEKYAFKGLTVGSEIIEEIMRHPEVEILSGEEAAKTAPWEITYKDINYIRFKYLPDEPVPDDPAYAEYDWYIPTLAQYAYACYLKRNIDAGLITLD
ncbi:MAG: hypothetical protein IJZ72_03355 [Oscillospiraceae bacterium]|nr:hypothetical protein [Oscillospiraceae bacterium]